MGAVTGNKWWGSFKHRIRDFTIKYGCQLNLDRTKVAKSLENKLSLTVDLARRDLQREASERYKGWVVRSRLKSSQRRCEMQRHIESVKSPDGHVLGSNRQKRNSLREHFRDNFARCPDLPVQEFPGYLDDFGRLKWLWCGY